MCSSTLQAETHKEDMDMNVFLNHASFSSSSSFFKESNPRSIQGQLIEVTVLAGDRLKNTEKFSRQDPYVYVQYGGTEYRTKTCKDGGTNPIFNDKLQFKLIEGLHKLQIRVFNENTFTAHDFIGRGTVFLEEALEKGFKEYSCSLLGQDKRSAGEIRLILHYPNAQKPETICAPPGPQPRPFQPPPHHQPRFYQDPPPHHQPPHQPPQYPTQREPHAYTHYEPPPPPSQPQAAYLPPHVYPPSPGPSTAPPSPYHGRYPPPYY